MIIRVSHQYHQNLPVSSAAKVASQADKAGARNSHLFCHCVHHLCATVLLSGQLRVYLLSRNQACTTIVRCVIDNYHTKRTSWKTQGFP